MKTHVHHIMYSTRKIEYVYMECVSFGSRFHFVVIDIIFSDSNLIYYL